MSIADEIQKLLEMHANGLLTKEEFTAAKKRLLETAPSAAAGHALPAAASSAVPPLPQPQAAKPRSSGTAFFLGAGFGALVRVALVLAVLGGCGWLALRFLIGGKAANRLVASAAHAPMVLVDASESVGANSHKAFPLTITYPGTLSVEATVTRGNGLNFVVISEDQLSAFNAQGRYRHFPTFEAATTKSYRRSGELAVGRYYLMVGDGTLGILSASSTDVRVLARLDP